MLHGGLYLNLVPEKQLTLLLDLGEEGVGGFVYFLRTKCMAEAVDL